MSCATVLGIAPNRRPDELVEFKNSHGWSSNIWTRLLGFDWYPNYPLLEDLWATIETLPEWKQAPLVLTFDTGVVPWQEFNWLIAQLIEFEAQIPNDPKRVNHVPAMIELLRSCPEVPLIGVWGTSVTDNPFDPWDEENDAPGNGIPLNQMYILERHRYHFNKKELT